MSSIENPDNRYDKGEIKINMTREERQNRIGELKHEMNIRLDRVRREYEWSAEVRRLLEERRSRHDAEQKGGMSDENIHRD